MVNKTPYLCGNVIKQKSCSLSRKKIIQKKEGFIDIAYCKNYMAVF